MSAGILVNNDVGDLLIDGSTPNHSCVHEGAATVSVSSAEAGFHTAPVANYFPFPITTDAPPLVALRWTVGTYAVTALRMLGSRGNWTGFIVHAGRHSGGQTEFTCSYRLFTNSVASQDQYGMRIWDANGKLVFDAGFPPLQVMHYFQNKNDWIDLGWTGERTYDVPNATIHAYSWAARMTMPYAFPWILMLPYAREMGGGYGQHLFRLTGLRYANSTTLDLVGAQFNNWSGNPTPMERLSAEGDLMYWFERQQICLMILA